MTFQVIVHRDVLKTLLRLDKNLVGKIRKEIGFLSEDPRPRNCKKLVGFEDCYRVRVGQYRILYRVDDAEQKVLVYRVAHGKESYR